MYDIFMPYQKIINGKGSVNRENGTVGEGMRGLFNVQILLTIRPLDFMVHLTGSFLG